MKCLRAVVNPFDAIFNLDVQLTQTLDVFFARLPVTSTVRFEEVRDHLSERVRVRFHQALLHFRISHERGVGVFVHPVVDLTRSRRPAESVVQTLLDLTSTFVARRHHTFVPLRVEKLGTRVQAHGLRKRAHLSVRSGGIRNVRRRHLTILTHTLDQLGRIRIKVVRHVGQRNFRRIEVLERDVNLGQGGFEKFLLRFHTSTRSIRVERERLAVQVHVLELAFIVPRRVFNGKVDVGRVGARRVGEDARRGFTDGHTEFFGLLPGMLTHVVHLIRFVLLGGELDGAIQQVHLVDKQVAEHTRAVDDDVDARAAEFFQRNELELVHPTERIGGRLDTNHQHDLS
mmetsp:Transcript_5658/g.12573  ORF Transcript_5658/g.12573 Transcript_5658/m.12573 type:complete len:343 (+) Transcript_5658:74-1102(+)